MNRFRPAALLGVAYKEFLHIARDWRILIVLISFPPAFTLLIGHAFEVTALSNAPTILRDEDGSAESQAFTEFLSHKTAFDWKRQAAGAAEPRLLQERVQGAVIIPKGWGAGLNNGDPIPIQAILDGTDTTTAAELEGALDQSLGEFQLKQREVMVDNLPEEMIELGKKIPVDFRNKIVSSMAQWTVKTKVLYNPEERFIDFVTPGIIGLILQLVTVPLMAVTITRERETGTLTRLLLTSLRHWEIVVGKVLPYLALSMIMVGVVGAIAHWHFGVVFHEPVIVALLCFLFLLCSLGLGLVISAFCNNQAQAIQVTVFFLLPIFPLCGAFAPLEQLPDSVRYFAEGFPLTHFCRAFREANLARADFSFIGGDVAFLCIFACATFAAAALLLRRAEN